MAARLVPVAALLVLPLLPAGPPAAPEPWADPNLPVRAGLQLWLDAGRAWGDQFAPADGRLAAWLDASGNKRHLAQKTEAALPVRLPAGRVLATSVEDGRPQPQVWSLEPGRGRVFVSVPGHYSWTFDDPLFRVLLLRGVAWAAREPVDRFNDLVWPGADVAK